MPDVVIKPASSNDDSGSIRMPDYRAVAKIIPTYLVVLETGKKESFFIATKYDEMANCVKFVGFHCPEPMDKIISSYDEIVKNTDKTKFVEIQFPWHRIISIQSLLYKHK